MSDNPRPNRRKGDLQIRLLQNKLDNHIEEFHTHRSEFADHCENEEKRWDHLIVAQESNTQAIKELTESTHDLISAWQVANGTVKGLAYFGRVVKWLSGFAVIGVFIKWVIDKGV